MFLPTITQTSTTHTLRPSNLITDIATLPNGPGVYFFYGINSNIPLYIGKSITLRQRIRSHYQAAHSHSKEFKITQQTHRIEVIETAGELSALLLESTLIKKLMPIYNHRLRRKKKMVGFTIALKAGYLTIECNHTNSLDTTLLGSFSNLTAAKNVLIDLVKSYQLCPKLCSLEKANTSCFSFQLHRCLGACLGKETAASYNQRVELALARFKQASWPYPSAIAIKEQNPALSLTNWLIFNHWRHIATVDNLAAFNTKKSYPDTYTSDRDSYHILRLFLTKQHVLDELVIFDD